MAMSKVPVSQSNCLPLSLMNENSSFNRTQVHGTAVYLHGQGILLRGPSGAGKSDLALRLIEAGGRLVADDRVDITREQDRLVLSAPDALEGKLEIRGLGIVNIETADKAPLALICDLVLEDQIERMPEESNETLLGHAIPVFVVNPEKASADAKIRYALKVATGAIRLTT